ncbi:hypothetical protein SAMN02745134_00276 [Clostridium acidisoli DSM 12555]|uniref:Uncharacterized protein n=1 Tax=Clostridium acidisoli DSM 12555 TaxID=1121291 RepID=A0A1W1X0A7_9CLOT|nr:hypothetical protein [Clostridium acidisoli]SMC17273.1 hypothetical protein SAMN02745134_00276 [Clostridium acidisoli DSM 12555]
MIDKETFRNTEKKLYNYFEKDKIVNSLKHKIELLNKHVNQIDEKLRSTDISIPEGSKSIAYEERVQTSSTGESYAERTALKITDRLIKEQSRKIDEICELEEKIRTIEADNIIMGDNIGGLRKEDFKFLETKYKKELPDWRVGVELHLTRSNVTRKKQKLIENVANWEEWENLRKYNI